MSDFDLVAAAFERHRALPDVATQQIIEAVLSLLKPAKVNLLDLGAGTGRLGRAFVSAQISYVGLDASYAMLDRFRINSQSVNGWYPSLVQADGRFLPFSSDTFTAVLLAHVLSASQNWQELLGEARRVLDSDGFLILAQRVGSARGLDAQLREELKTILGSMNVEMPEAGKMKRDARTWLGTAAKSQQHIVAATWKSDCSPRDFINRHSTGARFSALPVNVQQESMRRLSAWAVGRFGSLDAPFAEEYRFELDVFRF
jgi:ubiquinone/menaquinone biosynthesis C-methylase UbiE